MKPHRTHPKFDPLPLPTCFDFYTIWQRIDIHNLSKLSKWNPELKGKIPWNLKSWNSPKNSKLNSKNPENLGNLGNRIPEQTHLKATFSHFCTVLSKSLSAIYLQRASLSGRLDGVLHCTAERENVGVAHHVYFGDFHPGLLAHRTFPARHRKASQSFQRKA